MAGMKIAISTVVAVLAVAATSLAASSLNGTYSTTISSPAQLKGKWTVDFQPGNKYSVGENSKVDTFGQYTLSGSTITFKDTAGPGRCPGNTASGTYTIAVHGSSIAFKTKHDACAGRAAVLNGRTFTKG
jgi:hypothetical protein